MVEVVFGASEAASLKMSRLRNWADEIICLDLGLDVGEIRNLDNESKRSNALETLFRDGQKRESVCGKNIKNESTDTV